MKRTLYQQVRSRTVLHKAWRHVRKNGLSSLSIETQNAIKQFDEDAHRRLRRIEDQLRKHRFVFAPQTGVAKQRSGKKPRPIVIAAVENRIVQRAILDVLQNQPPIREILSTPSSFGGIGNRSVKDAIGYVNDTINSGAKYFVRSDIRDFFGHIPRDYVTKFLGGHFADDDFLTLFQKATETTLANLSNLGEDAEYFPLGSEGVAQGSPLSPLIGNILLRNFDGTMNGRRIICVRYIDDFVLLGPCPSALRKAFENAQTELGRFGMSAYDPWIKAENTSRAKSGHGKVEDGFQFLGCHIKPGLVQPCSSARDAILQRVDEALDRGKKYLIEAAGMSRPKVSKLGYAQTLVEIDRTVRGWGDAFAFCNGRGVFHDLDSKINSKLDDFRQLATQLCNGRSPDVKRRVEGVSLLGDTNNPASGYR